MSARLFVGNLSGAINNLRLEQLFARHGLVSSARIVFDEGSGCSQGCGYVQMASGDDAQKAIAALHGHVVDGCLLSVSEVAAQESEPVVRPARRRYGNGRSGGGVRSGRRA
jgi:RNA recognition motif-containing protein